MTLAVGAEVGGRYRVDYHIASGGMGSVYAVHHRDTGHRHALKVLKQTGGDGASTLERFRREAQLLDSFDHRGVVKMTDAGVMEDGSAFLVMELLEGETLLSFLRREAPIEPRRLVPIVRGMAEALDAVHGTGVIHRDLKPSNVFLTPDGIKLVDFGVAFGVDLVSLTMSGQVVGTVRYMAPEQLEGRRALDARADVYSMGLIIWAALAGRPPHGGTIAQSTMSIMGGTPRLETFAPAIPPRLADVVHRAIARRREDRFETAGAFTAAFEAALSEPAGRADPGLRWAHERTGFQPLPPTREVPSFRPPVAAAPAADAMEDDPTEVDPQPLGARRPRVVFLTIAAAAVVGIAVGVALFMLRTS
jgi:serine/threonine-protein kinase